MSNISRTKLINYLDLLLLNNHINDYCPNGEQVSGKSEIGKIVTAVTATNAVITQAAMLKADTLIVHHGLFFNKDPYPIVGIKYNRIEKLIKNGISLLSYHLPLDIHQTFGNNVQLASEMHCQIKGSLDLNGIENLGLWGECDEVRRPDAFSKFLSEILKQNVYHLGPATKNIKELAGALEQAKKAFIKQQQ